MASGSRVGKKGLWTWPKLISGRYYIITNGVLRRGREKRDCGCQVLSRFGDRPATKDNEHTLNPRVEAGIK